MSGIKIWFAIVGTGTAINLNSVKEGSHMDTIQSEGSGAHSASVALRERPSFGTVFDYRVIDWFQYAPKVILC